MLRDDAEEVTAPRGFTGVDAQNRFQRLIVLALMEPGIPLGLVQHARRDGCHDCGAKPYSQKKRRYSHTFAL